MKEPRFGHEEPRPTGYGTPLAHDAPNQPDEGHMRNTVESTGHAQSSGPPRVVAPGLHVRTDIPPPAGPQYPVDADGDIKLNDVVENEQNSQGNRASDNDSSLRRSTSASGFPRRARSQRAQAMAATHSSAGSFSPGSAYSSPQLAALNDITPLPSPIQLTASFWKPGSTHSLSRTSSRASQGDSRARSPSRSSSLRHKPAAVGQLSFGPPTPPKTSAQDNAPSTSLAPPKPAHTRNRSLSEYHPTALHVPQPRQAAAANANPARRVSQPGDKPARSKLHREGHRTVQRGVAPPSTSSAQQQQQQQQQQPPPSPPRILSPHKASISDGGSGAPMTVIGPTSATPPTQIYNVESIRTKQRRRYHRIREVGQGAFSHVVQAVREEKDDYTGPPRYVAVKVAEYGPAGGADGERVEVSIKREVEILKSINHPSLLQLKAFGSDMKMAFLVLDYCPGGDLFDLAKKRFNALVPSLIRRIFAELVGAVRYLHQNFIVHRDIKLENVLLNMTFPDIRAQRDWQTYPRAVITLSDFGLSRKIPQPPESPLLQTACGSDDYAAPEITMRQPYDGRTTDPWAMGVLLYALLENRLPFDPLIGTRGRVDPDKQHIRRSHLIARCEYSWFRYGDEDGEWDPAKGKELNGARLCVEGLLRRSSRRLTLDQVAEMDWVAGGIDLPEGLKRMDRETP